MATLGEELRKQRELRQVSLREISDATKINIRFLEALERNDFTHLPGGQFNKGFIRAYARFIGIDAERMIDAYEELRRARDLPPEAPFPEPEAQGADRRWLVLAAGVVILVVAILATIWLVRRTWFSPEPSLPEPVADAEVTGVAVAGRPDGVAGLRMTGLDPLYSRVSCDGKVIFEGLLDGDGVRAARCSGMISIVVGEQRRAQSIDTSTNFSDPVPAGPGDLALSQNRSPGQGMTSRTERTAP